MWNPFRRQPQPQLRTPDEVRSITSVPWEPAFNVGPSKYGRPSESKALGLSAVFAAVRFLCDGVSTLPLKAYRKTGPDDQERMPSLPQLFQFLAEQGTLVDWCTQAMQSLVIHGNAIGVITARDGFGFPTGVVWRPRSEFTVDDEPTGRPLGGPAQWFWNGRQVEREALVHIPWITVPGKTLGLSPIEYQMLTVTSGLEAQSFGTNWFTSGGVPPGTFKNTNQTVNQEMAAAIKARLVSAIRSGEPIVYGNDWDFAPITIPPEQAQFIESQKYSATQVAAIYGIAPEEVGGESPNSLDYNTEEMRMTRRVSDWRPYMVRFETGFSALLPERQIVRFDADAIMRADLKTRMESYKIAREIGILTVNEIRSLEDMAPLPGGDDAEALSKAPEPKAITTGPGPESGDEGEPLRVVS